MACTYVVPTVYDDSHIGNARPLVIFDILFKVLKCKYGNKSITYIRNITDIDDKIIQSSQDNNIAITDLTKKIIKNFNDDCNFLNCENPSQQPKATDNIEIMINMISELINKGFAYESKKHIYFEVNKFKDYGCLSNKKLEDLIAGSRVEVSENKKNLRILFYGNLQMTMNLFGVLLGERVDLVGIWSVLLCQKNF